MTSLTWRSLSAVTLLALATTGAGPAYGHGPATPPAAGATGVVPELLRPTAAMRLPAADQAALDATVRDAAAAFDAFLATLTDAQRGQLLFPLDAPQRTASRDATLTPSFCAVLAWCVPGWGLTMGALSFEQRAAFEAFLQTALGPAGYAMNVTVRNRQNLIGALEGSANTQAVDAGKALGANAAYGNLAELAAALQAAGKPLSPEATAAAAIGGMNPGTEDWHWDPPGMAVRWDQFGKYAVAVFGRPGDRAWAVRFEGHHLSVNLTFVRDGSHWQVHATPLFIGSFPIVVPPPVGAATASDPLAWQQGQSFGLGLALGFKRFWLAVPEAQRRAAHRAAETYPQRPPFANQTPAAPMLASLAIHPDAKLLAAGPHLAAAGAALPAEARRQLAAVLRELFAAQHPAVAAGYLRRLDAALKSGRVVATWAGGDPADPASQHFSSIAVGPFLVEAMQTPEYSVASPRIPWSNHLHVMLRDLASPIWGDPLGAHLQAGHAGAPAR